MAGRPVDHRRRAELLDAITDYAVEQGFSELTWRPVAAALGVTSNTLVHHFGTKEQMFQAVLKRLRERLVAATDEILAGRADLATAARRTWEWTSDSRRGQEFRLFFAVYGRALQAPQQFSEFLEQVVADWMGSLCTVQGPEIDPATAARNATLVIATIRGLLLDLLATGDQDRVQDAAEAFLTAYDRRPRTGMPCPQRLTAPGQALIGTHERGRHRRRSTDRRWWVGALIDALTLVGLVGRHVPVGVADAHVPRHRVVDVILSQVEQRIPRTPGVRPIAPAVDPGGRRAVIVGVGDAGTKTGQTQTAGCQEGGRERHECSLHRPWANLTVRHRSPQSRWSTHVDASEARLNME